MTVETKSQRSLRARIAAYAMHAQGKTNTAPARQAQLDRFAEQIRAEAAARGENVTDAEVGERVEFKRREWMARMSRLAVAARAKKRRAKKND